MTMRFIRRWCGVVCIVLALASAASAAPRAIVLLESKGFVHDVVKRSGEGPSVVESVLKEMAERSDAFEPTFTYDGATITAEALRDAKLVVLYTTGNPGVSPAALRDFVHGGGALLGIHCATDTFADDAIYPGLIGGTFDGHPWSAGDTVTIKVQDASHPAAAPYAASSELLTFKEEIYQFKNFDPWKVRVLLSLDAERTAKKPTRHVPIAWCKAEGGGRVFYTSLGHREDVWRSEVFQSHLLGGIDWLLGKREGNAAPNPQVHEAEQKVAQAPAEGDRQPAAKAEGGPPTTDALHASGADAHSQPGAAKRPRDPWVFRSVLDKNARMITIVLHPDLWVAYDAHTLSLYKAWRGGVEFKGAVYDGRHGPQPESKAEQVYFERSTEQRPLSLVRHVEGRTEPVDAKLQYRGYRFDNGGVVLLATLTLPDGAVVRVEERPEHGTSNGEMLLQREFRTHGLPDGYSVQTHTLGAGSGRPAVSEPITSDEHQVVHVLQWPKQTSPTTSAPQTNGAR